MRRALQTQSDPAAVGAAQGHGSNTKSADLDMNENHPITTSPGSPVPFGNPADDVNRARSVVLTVWFALNSPDLTGGRDPDIGAIADTLYEAVQRLANAEKTLEARHA